MRAIVLAILLCVVSAVPTALGQSEAETQRDSLNCKGYGRTLALTDAIIKAYVAAKPDADIEVGEAPFFGGTGCLAKESCDLAAIPCFATEDEVGLVRFKRSEELVCIPIAKDALVLIVTKDNPVESLTVEQVGQIFTGKIMTWEELGVKIPRLKEGNYSTIHKPMLADYAGTVKVLERLTFPGKGIVLVREQFPNSMAVAQKTQADVLSLGVARMDYPGGVKVVPISKEADSTPVVPTKESVSSGEYPISHYVYWCFVGQPDGRARDLVEFAVSPAGQDAVEKAGLGFSRLPSAKDD